MLTLATLKLWFSRFGFAVSDDKVRVRFVSDDREFELIAMETELGITPSITFKLYERKNPPD